MEIHVENDLCQGHGRCNALAPDVFELDDTGYVALTGRITVADGLEEQAREGVAACPEGALRVLGA
jgi:ferredoxin